jgi:hypothetical protein
MDCMYILEYCVDSYNSILPACSGLDSRPSGLPLFSRNGRGDRWFSEAWNPVESVLVVNDDCTHDEL